MLLITIINMVDLSESQSRKYLPLLAPVETWAQDPPSEAPALRPRTQMQRHLNREEQLEVVEAYRAGATMKVISQRFKIHRTTVRAILDRHGVTPRPATERARPSR